MLSRNSLTILFWGALWGLAEATIGMAVHLAHLPGKGVIMGVIGVAMMLAAVNATGRARAAVAVALVAAAIKLTDLLVLGPAPAWWVLNPAMWIALEGVAMTAVCALVKWLLPTVWQTATRPITRAQMRPAPAFAAACLAIIVTLITS